MDAHQPIHSFMIDPPFSFFQVMIDVIRHCQFPEQAMITLRDFPDLPEQDLIIMISLRRTSSFPLVVGRPGYFHKSADPADPPVLVFLYQLIEILLVRFIYCDPSGFWES